MRVLIVDDDEIALDLLEYSLVEAGYRVQRATNGRDAIEMLRSGNFRLVVSDWEMPEMNGLELCRKIREKHHAGYTYVILVTSHEGTDNVIQGLDAGADDFITKPFQPQELCCRLRVGERLLSLESRNLMIFALAKLAESRDPDTGAHLERIREYCRVVAEDLSNHPDFQDVVDGDYVHSLYLTSPLHDIGKVGIPDTILLKPGRLTAEEFEFMKRHVVIGGNILNQAVMQLDGGGFLAMAALIAQFHHERWDGQGYPAGLAGEEIPLPARIVAVADVYDALTSKRPYKDAWPAATARQAILQAAGTQFDPVVAAAFDHCFTDILKIQRELADQPSLAVGAMSFLEYDLLEVI
jgi:putative two-component system response regulator